MIDVFLMRRIAEYPIGLAIDPWGSGMRLELLRDDSIPLIADSFSAADERGHDWSAEQHAGRIRFLMRNSIERLKPILMRGGHSILLTIEDGWHRYIAKRELGENLIEVDYVGVPELAEYLGGRSGRKP